MNYNETMHTGTILRQLIRVMFLAVLVACNAPADEPLSTQNWVIFTESQAEETGIASWLLESDAYWTPSVDDILKLEENITDYLSQNSNSFNRQPPVWERLDEYKRQYIGLERGGRQIIFGNYFCSSEGKNWRQELVFAIDGGECYFQVEYDVETELFIKLLVNGES